MKNEKNTIKAFIRGFASVFDLTGGIYIFIPNLMNGHEKDNAAIREDWNRVGSDIKRSMYVMANE